MPDQQIEQINAIVKQINDLSAKMAGEFATRADVAKMEDALKAFEAKFGEYQMALERAGLESRQHPIFGNVRIAKDFADVLGNVLEKALPGKLPDDAPIIKEKATLNVTVAAEGGYTVPTELSSTLLELVTRGGMARRVHTVFEGVRGTLDLPKGASEASAGFTANDTAALPETDKAFGKASLSPEQVGALFRSSAKLVRNSVLSIATIVADELTRAAGRLEDNCVLIGDGSPTYGGITGYQADANVASTTVANLDALDLDKLIDLQVAVHEEIDPERATYYISRQVAAHLKKLKDDGGRYLIELGTPTPNINGVPVVIWKRMPTPAAGKLLALYGDLRTAGKVATGRDVAIAVSEHVDFTKGGLVWRLLYDFDFGIHLPGAVAKIKMQ